MRLENVLSWDASWPGEKPPTLTIVMSYIGGDLSVNRYKWGHFTKPHVRKWMDDLAYLVKLMVSAHELKFTTPLVVRVAGEFKDKRSAPDLANCHKVVGDALQAGLMINGKVVINDREFRFQDGDVVLGSQEPKVIITIGG